MLNLTIAVLIAAGVIVFARSAYTGVGPASRIVQFFFTRIGSINHHQKSGRVFRSAQEIVASGGEPVLAGLIGRIAPDQVGWFSRRFPTDKGHFHDYLRSYDALFAPYRTQPDLRLLEVGVKKGGSLVLWRELFDESAFIYGIDVNPDVPHFPRDAHIKVLTLDSTDEPLVQRALHGLAFDIIIDDGLHTPEAQFATFNALLPFLRPSGVYVIEDVYDIDVTRYEAHGLQVELLPDRSGQSLAVLYPAASLALSARA